MSDEPPMLHRVIVWIVAWPLILIGWFRGQPKYDFKDMEERIAMRMCELFEAEEKITMPLTGKGEEIKKNMEEHYGKEKGEQVFYASANKGTIKGVHDALDGIDAIAQATPVQDAATLNWAGGEHVITKQEQAPEIPYPKNVSSVEK